MLLIAGAIRVSPEKVAEAREAAARMIAATRAEDGCEQYAFAEDVLDPGLIHISEVWRDQAALERHRATEHMGAWRIAMRDLAFHERNLKIYEVDAGRRL